MGMRKDVEFLKIEENGRVDIALIFPKTMESEVSIHDIQNILSEMSKATPFKNKRGQWVLRINNVSHLVK